MTDKHQHSGNCCGQSASSAPAPEEKNIPIPCVACRWQRILKKRRASGCRLLFLQPVMREQIHGAPENYVKAKRVIGMGSVPAASAASTSAPVTTANVAAADPVVREVSRVKPAVAILVAAAAMLLRKVCNTTRKARIKIRSAG
jgi:hypothetical protein